MSPGFTPLLAAARRLRLRLGDDRGVALIMSISMLSVTSVSIAAMLQFTAAATRGASLSHGNERAFSVSEAGLNEALAKLSVDPGNKDILPNPDEGETPLSTSASDGSVTGTATYYGKLDSSTDTWTVSATGSVPNTTGGAATTRTVSTQLRTYVTTTPSTNDDIWKYVFTDAPTCTTLSHSSNVTVWSTPVYVKRNLCLTNNLDMTGTPVQVGGTLTRSGNSAVGSSASPVAATILGGCTGGVPNPHTCGVADRVWTNTGALTLTPALSKPTFDLAAMTTYYRNAQPGPANTCNNAGGTLPPGGFDNDYSTATQAPNTSRIGTSAVNLTPTTAYDCQFKDGSGVVRGKLKWTPGSPGTLEVLGTIYFDGDIAYTGSAKYTGRGAIYASGRITFSNLAQLCVTTNCASTWDPNTHVLVLVAGSNRSSVSSPTGFAIDLGQNAKFQGSFMTNGDYRQQNNAVTWASVVARWISMANSSNTYGIPGFVPLSGLPTTTQPIVKAEPLAGTFRG